MFAMRARTAVRFAGPKRYFADLSVNCGELSGVYLAPIRAMNLHLLSGSEHALNSRLAK